MCADADICLKCVMFIKKEKDRYRKGKIKSKRTAAQQQKDESLPLTCWVNETFMNLMLLGEKRVTQLECPSCVHYRCACFCCFVPALRCTIVELLHNELRLQLPVIIYTHTLVHTFKAKVFLFTKRFFSYAKFTFDFGRFIFSVV